MKERSGTQRKPNPGVLGFLAGMQITLAAVAWSDLAVRPAAEIRGSKRRWALIIAINFAGPIAYFTWGRRPVDPAGHSAETP
ncbi:PLDc N-terminal domain-containing protein [Amycolatopsis pittospori]|uniref:PLDc N-terminal domain-containing protein n=1 Tax=Amycolatopsis pittospori TaxID=2749434 RepID=UPI0015F0D0F2|nr:PLDc N-terminal domain-containing protein [Amycolatopsis pittospori]